MYTVRNFLNIQKFEVYRKLSLTDLEYSAIQRSECYMIFPAKNRLASFSDVYLPVVSFSPKALWQTLLIPYMLTYKSVFWELVFGPKLSVRLIMRQVL
jgi:hypothetical protein